MAPSWRELDVFFRELERAPETIVAFAITVNSFGIYDEEAKGRLQTQYFNSPVNLITSLQVGR